MRDSPSGRILFVLAGVLALAACGRGDAIDDSLPAKEPRAAVGEILELIDPLLTVNQNPATTEDQFAADSTLRTDEKGAGRFNLEQRFDDCQMRRESEIHVLPSGSHFTLRLNKGTATCMTPAGKQKKMELGTPHGIVDVRDPIFTVEVQPEQTVVRVAEGFVQVRGLAGEGPRRLVGPDQQVIVRAGGPADLVAPYDPQALDPAEREAIGRMKAALPDPPVGLPAAEGSPALTRIGEAKTLRLAVDPGADERSARFIQGLFNFIGEHWGVKVDRTSMSPAAATAALGAGGVDIFVPPLLLEGTRSIPFFADEAQRAWLLHVAGGDSRFESALRDFLFSTLNVGEYGRRYADAFSRLPDYEVLRPVVFADEGPSSEPATTPTTTASEPTTTTSRPTPTSRPASTTSTTKAPPPAAPNTTSTTRTAQPSTAESPPPTTSTSPSTTSTTSGSSVSVDCSLIINQSNDQC